jgi:hypothetical protein
MEIIYSINWISSLNKLIQIFIPEFYQIININQPWLFYEYSRTDENCKIHEKVCRRKIKN